MVERATSRTYTRYPKFISAPIMTVAVGRFPSYLDELIGGGDAEVGEVSR